MVNTKSVNPDLIHQRINPTDLESNLLNSAAELQALFGAMNDFVFVFDGQGDYLKTVPTNPDLLQQLSVDQRQEALTQFVPAAQEPQFLAVIQRSIATQQTTHTEYSLQVNNTEIFFEASISPLAETSVVWVARDVTERRQTELELRRSEERFRSYFDLPLVGIAITSPEKGWVAVNDRACEMLGYSRKELIQLTWSELTHPEDLVLDLQLFEQMLAGNLNQYSIDKRYFCKDGRLIYASLAIGCTRKPDGTIDYVVALIQDITDRKQAEAALRQSEQQLREQAERERLLNRLIRHIRNSLDFNTILQTTLPEIRQFLKIDRCHFAWYYPIEAEPYWEVVSESCSPDLPKLIGRYPATTVGSLADRLLEQQMICIADVETVEDEQYQQFVRSLNYRAVLVIPMQTQSGSIGVIVCSQSTAVRHWSDEEVELLQVVMSQLAIALNQADLLAQSRAKAKELEQALNELKQTQAQMIQSEKMSSLGQLVAGVAHEINNPVNFIYGNLSYARDYTSDLLNLLELYRTHYPDPVAAVQDEAEAIDLEFLIADLPKLLNSMRVGADRIQEIVQSLRNFSRMDEAEQKAVNIHDGIDSTLMILQSRLKAKPDMPEIVVLKHYDDLPLVECFPGQLNQVFMNLLANAIDALEDAKITKPEIKIRTNRLNDQAIVIQIADNGVGIPEHLQKRLFDPFFTTKPVGKGTGLGLSISYQIVVEKHRGEISCRSSLGKGTEFIITIPIQQQKPDVCYK